MQSASRGDSAMAIAEFDREIAKDPDLARIWLQSIQPEPPDFNDIDHFRFVTAARSMIGLFEDQYMQGVAGTAPKEQGDMYVAAIVGLLELPAWREFWQSETAARTWRHAFVEAVSNNATPYQISATTFRGRPA